MCLIVDKCNALVAEEDITCYKVYMDYGYGNERYRSPFRLDLIKKFNKVIHVPEFLDPIEGNEVYLGFHTFCDEEDAEYFETLYPFYKVFKCIIPKGSRYYKGIAALFPEKSTPGYCSESLIVISDDIKTSPLEKLKKFLSNLFCNS